MYTRSIVPILAFYFLVCLKGSLVDEECRCYGEIHQGASCVCEFKSTEQGNSFQHFLDGHGILSDLTLHWHSTPVPHINDGSLAKLPNLYRLTLIGAGQHQFTNKTFAGLHQLSSLQIRSSDIPLWSTWIWPLGSLETLYLNENRIPTWSLKDFCALQQLQHLGTNRCLVFSNTGIDSTNKTLDRPPQHACLPKLIHLYLSFTNISLLNLTDIKDNSSLRWITAESANISEVTGIDARMIMNLELLDLRNNRLSAFTIQDVQDCHASNLLRLYLQNNQLTNISPGLFNCTQNLVSVDLSGNKLTTNPFQDASWDGFRSLGVINLASNSISSFTVKSLQNCNSSHVSILDLQNNQLQNISLGSSGCMSHLKSLDLSGNKLSGNPFEIDGFDDLRELKELYLNNNSLSSFTFKSIEKCNYSMLSDLFLQNNQIRSFSHGLFKCMKQLKNFDISHNQLQSNHLDHADLNNLKNLRKLNMSHNRLSSFTILDVKHCDWSMLLELYLQNNQLTNISQGLFNCTRNITHLDLSENDLTTDVLMKAHLNTLRKLKYLYLSGNNIKLLQAGLTGRLKELEVFSCKKCGMTSITKNSLIGAEKLRLLVLSENSLSVVDSHMVSSMTSLRRLDLSGNNLTSFAIKCNGLRELVLQRNQLEFIPDFNRSCNKLVLLNLNENRITYYDLHKFAGLYDLTHILVAFNNIRQVPTYQFQQVIPLEYIDLSHNALQEIENTHHSTQLNINATYVDLSYNLLEHISLRKWLRSGKHINLSRNRLTVIRGGDIHLTSLESLDLSFNLISTIHKDAFVLPSLRTVNLTFNKLRYLNEEALAVSTAADPRLMIYLQGNFLHCDCHNYLLNIANSHQ